MGNAESTVADNTTAEQYNYIQGNASKRKLDSRPQTSARISPSLMLSYGDDHSVIFVHSDDIDDFTRLSLQLVLQFTLHQDTVLTENITLGTKLTKLYKTLFSSSIRVCLTATCNQLEIRTESDFVRNIVFMSIIGAHAPKMIITPFAYSASTERVSEYMKYLRHVMLSGIKLHSFRVTDSLSGESKSYDGGYLYFSPRVLSAHIQTRQTPFACSLSISPQSCYYEGLLTVCPLLWLRPSTLSIKTRVPTSYLHSVSLYDMPRVTLSLEGFQHIISIVFFQYTQFTYTWRLAVPIGPADDQYALNIAELLEIAIYIAYHSFRPITDEAFLSTVSASLAPSPGAFRKNITIQRGAYMDGFTHALKKLLRRTLVPVPGASKSYVLQLKASLPRVSFKDEEGEDAGGLLREFYSGLSEEFLATTGLLSSTHIILKYLGITPALDLRQQSLDVLVQSKERLQCCTTLGTMLALALTDEAVLSFNLAPSLLYLLTTCIHIKTDGIVASSSVPKGYLNDGFYGSGLGYYRAIQKGNSFTLHSLVDNKIMQPTEPLEGIIAQKHIGQVYPSFIPALYSMQEARTMSSRDASTSATGMLPQEASATDDVKPAKVFCGMCMPNIRVAKENQRITKREPFVGLCAVALHPFDALTLYFLSYNVFSETTMNIGFLLYPDLQRLGLDDCFSVDYGRGFLCTHSTVTASEQSDGLETIKTIKLKWKIYERLKELGIANNSLGIMPNGLLDSRMMHVAEKLREGKKASPLSTSGLDPRAIESDYVQEVSLKKSRYNQPTVDFRMLPAQLPRTKLGGIVEKELSASIVVASAETVCDAPAAEYVPPDDVYEALHEKDTSESFDNHRSKSERSAVSTENDRSTLEHGAHTTSQSLATVLNDAYSNDISLRNNALCAATPTPSSDASAILIDAIKAEAFSQLAPVYACQYAYYTVLGFTYHETCAVANGFYETLIGVKPEYWRRAIQAKSVLTIPASVVAARCLNRSRGIITAQALRKAATFSGSPELITSFMKAFEMLTPQQRERLLQFCTGTPYLTDRSLSIQFTLPPDYFPQGRTCAFLLEMPMTTDTKKLYDVLKTAITHMYFGFL